MQHEATPQRCVNSLRCVVPFVDQSYGKTALMKALLHLSEGKNETIEVLVSVSERLGDIKKFVNAEFTSSYYKGQLACD